MDTVTLMQQIIARSPRASDLALRAINAQRARSPMALRRAAKAAELALRDPEATWSSDERAALAELVVGGDRSQERSVFLRLRVTPEERTRIREGARAAGLTVSNYIRDRLGLAIVDYWQKDDADAEEDV